MMIRTLTLALPSVLFAAALAPAAADAQMIPLPVYTDQITYQIGGNPVQSQSDLTNSPNSFSFSGGGVSALSQTSNLHGGTVTAQASATGYSSANPNQTSAGSNATLHWYIEAAGAGTTPVPVHLVANGSVTGSGSVDDGTGHLNHLYSAEARFLFHTSDSTAVNYDLFSGASDLPQSFAVNQTVFLTPNQLYYVEIFAVAGANPGFQNVSPTASAMVDPLFSIDDPGFASQYTLRGLLGDAIVTPPASGVPEPASWAMMIGGFGLAGAALRRRVARTVAA